jgi:hypothetical protein
MAKATKKPVLKKAAAKKKSAVKKKPVAKKKPAAKKPVAKKAPIRRGGSRTAQLKAAGLKDKAAIVGVGTTEFSKNSGRSELSLAC